MSYLTKNLSVLDRELGLDHAAIEELICKAEQEYEMVPTKTGKFGLIYHGADGDIALHSKYDPMREAVRIVDNIKDLAEAHIIIVFGFGLGYHIEVLLQRLKKHQRIFVIEPSNGPGLFALGRMDLTSILSSRQVQLLIIDEPKDAGKTFGGVFDFQRDDQLAFVFHASEDKIFRNFFSEANQSIVDCVHAKSVEEKTLIKIGFDVVESSVLNIDAYINNPCVNQIFDTFKEVPAFIVSAGPSLNKNVHLLKNAKNKGIIIAVGTAVNTLQASGIEPDIVACIDPGIPNYKIFQKIKIKETVLVADLQSHYRIVDEFTGPKFMFSSPGSLIMPWLHSLRKEEEAYLPCGGSVANTACSLAYKMGCNPIVFVGQDLCLGDEGHTHAGGSVYEADTAKFEGTIPVEGNDGTTVRTFSNWYQFKKWFENWIEENDDREYINATEGGARIYGTKIQKLQEVIEKYCKSEVQPFKKLVSIAAEFRKPNNKQGTYAMLTEKSKLVGEVEKKLKKARVVLVNTNQSAKKMNEKLRDKLFKQVSDINHYLTCSDEFFLIEQVDYTVVVETLRKTHEGGRDEEDTFARAAKDTIEYYTAMIDATKKFREVLEQAKKRMMGEEAHDAE